MLAGISTEEEMNQEELIIEAERSESGENVFPFLFIVSSRLLSFRFIMQLVAY